MATEIHASAGELLVPLRDGPSAVRTQLLARWHCRSDVAFAFAVSLIWGLFYNARFWMETIHAMWRGSVASVAFLASLFLLVWSLQAVLLLLLPSRRLMLGAASICFVVAAAGSYFATRFGVVLNEDMLRNVFETDVAEARSLVGADSVGHILLWGLLPALLVWKVQLPATPWSQRMRRNWTAIVCSVGACVVALLSCPAAYAVYFREHKPIRYSLVPAAPVTSAISLALDKSHGDRGPPINVSGRATRVGPPHPKPLVIVLIVGETARAANFELGGYGRRTNEELRETEGLVYFPDTTSCGTATAQSVPCMFSHLPRRDFDVEAADRYTNLLDALRDAGIQVEWRDNNAGCKGVCARVETARYQPDSDPRLCQYSYCYDEILLTGLEEKLSMIESDTVIVMHQIGSHGPAYFERYPPDYEKFRPACHSNELQRCSPEEIRNAYDNTIAYTDHVLAQTIALLRQAAEDVDPMLIYVSDHGESLGEQGLYLHGLPHAFAPETQTHVPMLMWLSPSYASRGSIAIDCIASRSSAAFSHDNIYHTVLGAAEVRNVSYDPSLDILATCRRSTSLQNHE
jgi:lipid A ethanolaminephosphotransferase